MTPREFGNACEGFSNKKERESRERWEQARLIASQIYNKPVWGYKIKGLSTEKFLPLPWDKEQKDFSEEIDKIKEYRQWLQEQ